MQDLYQQPYDTRFLTAAGLPAPVSLCGREGSGHVTRWGSKESCQDLRIGGFGTWGECLRLKFIPKP